MTTTSTFQNYGPEQALNAAAYVRQNAPALGLAPEDLDLPIKALIPLGKGVASSPTLIRAVRKYIVPFNGKFYSYPLTLLEHPTSKDLFKMQAPVPNILREGLVVVGIEVFFVKLEDLKRGIVRKSRKLPIPLKRTVTYKDFIDGLACTATPDLPDDHYYSTRSIAKRRAALDAAASGSLGGGATTSDTGEAESLEHLLSSGPEGSIDLDEESRLIDLAYQEQIGSLLSDSDS